MAGSAHERSGCGRANSPSPRPADESARWLVGELDETERQQAATGRRVVRRDGRRCDERRRIARSGHGRWSWRRATLSCALAALAVLATSAAWSDMLAIAWRDADQSQALLAPLVAAWLFWVRRGRLRTYVPRDARAGLAMVALGSLLHLAGDQFLVRSMWHFGAVLVAAGAFLSVAGDGFLARFLPAFAALCALVPVPLRAQEAVALPLQAAAARTAQAVLDTLGVAVDRSGSTLRFDGREVTLADDGSGLRMALALALVTFAFAYGTPLREWVRAVIVMCSPLVAIAFSVAWIVPAVWTSGRLADGAAAVLHGAFGWLTLLAAFLSLLGLLRLFRWTQLPVSPYVLASGS